MSDTYETMLLISQAVRSNVSLSEAIRLSIVDAGGDRFQQSLLRFAKELDQGYDLPEAARRAKLPKKLSLYLEAAKVSGDFPDYFAELTEAERSRSKTHRMLANLLAYPLFMVAVMAGVIAIAVWVLPQFEHLFRDFDTTLPAMTELVLAVGRFLSKPEFYVMVGVFIAVLLVLQRLLFPAFWFYVPIIGRIFWTLSVEKLLRQLLVSIRYRHPLDEALRLAAKSFKYNRVQYRDCMQASELAREGAKLSLLISIYPLLFPNWLLPLVRMAEQNDTIPAALRRGLEILDEDRSGTAMMFGTALIPICCFLVITICGFTVASLFLPLIKLITCLSG